MSRGHDRERAVKAWFEQRDWVVIRAAGSLGDIDLACLRDGYTPLFVEVKSTAGGPYERFGPAARAELLLAAKLAGAKATLAWWPPRGKLRFIPSDEWPEARAAA